MIDLVDVVLEGIKKVFAWIIGLFMEGLRSGYQTLTVDMFGTPTPRTAGMLVFGEPTNAPWKNIQDALVGGEIMLIALLLLTLSVQGRHVLRIFDLGSGYETRKIKKNAWIGAVLIVTWYWISVLALYLIDGFTIALIPDLSSVIEVMLHFLRKSISNTGLALLFAILGGLSMWALEALFYIREVLLYVYLYGMPIGIALAYGNIPILSNVAMGFCKRFVPLAILPLPAAIVFKGYDLIYGGTTLTPPTPFLKYLIAVSLPLVALYVTWKTFQYATPLTARVIGTATKSAALLGGVAAGASLGGAGIARTAARWGPTSAAGHAVAQRAASRHSDDEEGTEPSYRRTENDPSGATTESSPDAYGPDFDRGIH